MILMAKKKTIDFLYRLKKNIVKLEKESSKLTTKMDEIATKLTEYQEVMDVVEGLKKTPKMNDPGKYGKAYYFVKRLDKDDAERSSSPGLQERCKATGKLVPLVMSYEQTYDSPEGDTWEKRIFYIRGDNRGVVEVTRFVREDRF